MEDIMETLLGLLDCRGSQQKRGNHYYDSQNVTQGNYIKRCSDRSSDSNSAEADV